MICKELPSNGTQKIEDIPHVHEQQFFLLVRQKAPHLGIVYEGSIFEITEDNGTVKSTKPDFSITLKDGTRKIVELTTLSRTEDEMKKKTKQSKRKIVQTVSPCSIAIVLYRKNLENMQRHNPDYDFFNAKLRK